MFSPFVDNGSHRGLLKSQSFRNGFITFSRLIDVKYFVSHLFLNFFGHDVLAFWDLLAFVRQVLLKRSLDLTGLVVINLGVAGEIELSFPKNGIYHSYFMI